MEFQEQFSLMPFQSFEFKKFAKDLDINVLSSSPLYPKSNGLSEKAVHIVKRMLDKSGLDNLWLSLLEYRNTPLSDLEVSPTQLIFGKKNEINSTITSKSIQRKASTKP